VSPCASGWMLALSLVITSFPWLRLVLWITQARFLSDPVLLSGFSALLLGLNSPTQ
jgi:hypothetical protein